MKNLVELIAKIGGGDVVYDRFYDKLRPEKEELKQKSNLSAEEIVKQISINTGIILI